MKSHLAGLSLLSIVLCTVPTTRGEELLGHVPDDAFVVIRFASVDKVLGNTDAYLTAIGPLAAQGIDEVKRNLESMTNLMGNGLRLIDRSEPFYVAAFPYFDHDHPIVVFMKANDEKAVRRAAATAEEDGEIMIAPRDDGFVEVTGERTVYFTRRGGYIAFTRDEVVLNHMSEANTKMESFADALGERALALVNAGDVSVAVHAAPVIDKHKEDIESARREVNKFIDVMPDEQLGTGSPQATRKFYKSLVKFTFNALYDTRWAVGSVKLDADGASAEGLIGFKQDSVTDKFLAANPPSAMSNLGRLPAGAPMYFGAKLDTMEWVWHWVRMNYGDNPEHRKAINKAFKTMEAAKLDSTVVSYSLPKDAETGIVATTLQQLEKPVTYRKGWRNYIQAVGTVETPLLSQTLAYKKNAEKYKGRAIDLLTMEMEIADNEIAAMVKGMYQRMFGGDTFQSRLTVVDDLIVQSTGNDANTLRSVLDSLESGEGTIGAEREFRNSRDQLPKEANLYVLLDIPRTIVDTVGMLRDVEPFSEGLEMIPFQFGVQPPVSYTGFSIGHEPQGVRFKGYLPVQQVKGLFQIFGPSL